MAKTKKPKLIDALWEYAKTGRKTDDGGCIIANRGSYLSGLPYMFSGFPDRAFVFANSDEAAGFIARYPKELGGYEVRMRNGAAIAAATGREIANTSG